MNWAQQIHCFAEDFVYETVKAHLKARGMAMNNQWYHRCALGFAYEMKVHNGVFAASGLIHSV